MAEERHRSSFWGTFRSYLVAGALLSLGAGVAGLAPALMAPKLFDVPGAVDNPALWALVLTVVAFPIVCFLGPIAAYIAYQAKRRVLAVALIAAPLYLAASAVIVCETSAAWVTVLVISLIPVAAWPILLAIPRVVIDCSSTAVAILATKSLTCVMT